MKTCLNCLASLPNCLCVALLPPTLTPDPPPAKLLTPEQLNKVADEYANMMRALGFDIDKLHLTAIQRMAGIQDVWRVAFARVIGS